MVPPFLINVSELFEQVIDDYYYLVLDSSSKTPSNFLGGSVSSFGDFDQCLQTSSEFEKNNFNGKYCTFKLGPDKNIITTREIDKVFQEQYPVFAYYYIQQAICLPSTCDDQDAINLIDFVLLDLPIHRKLNIHCDTKETISMVNKIKTATTGQWIASTFLTAIVSLVILGSLEEFVFSKDNRKLTHFSAVSSTKRLFQVKTSGRVVVIDIARVSVIIFGTIGHAIGCLETVPGWYTVARLYALKDSLSHFWVQPMLNEGGLGIGITYVGGFVTFWATEKAVNSNTINYVAAVFDRWIRYMPSIMVMVAIDIVWPFFGDGPMHTQVSKHLVGKCTRNAWMNFFMIGNMKSAPENVSLFYQNLMLMICFSSVHPTHFLLKH